MRSGQILRIMSREQLHGKVCSEQLHEDLESGSSGKQNLEQEVGDATTIVVLRAGAHRSITFGMLSDVRQVEGSSAETKSQGVVAHAFPTHQFLPGGQICEKSGVYLPDFPPSFSTSTKSFSPHHPLRHHLKTQSSFDVVLRTSTFCPCLASLGLTSSLSGFFSMAHLHPTRLASNQFDLHFAPFLASLGLASSLSGFSPMPHLNLPSSISNLHFALACPGLA